MDEWIDKEAAELDLEKRRQNTPANGAPRGDPSLFVGQTVQFYSITPPPTPLGLIAVAANWPVFQIVASAFSPAGGESDAQRSGLDASYSVFEAGGIVRATGGSIVDA